MRGRASGAATALATSGGTALSSARAITWSKIDFFVCGHEVLCGENCFYRVEKHLYFCIHTKMPSRNPLPPKENALFKRILVSKRSANFLFWSPTLVSPPAYNRSADQPNDEALGEKLKNLNGNRLRFPCNLDAFSWHRGTDLSRWCPRSINLIM